MSDLETELRSSESSRTLSTMYNMLAVLDTSKVSQLFTCWQCKIPELADDWEEGIQQYLTLLILSRNRSTQLKFLHRAYYSPLWLARIYPDQQYAQNAAQIMQIFPYSLVLSKGGGFLEGGPGGY